LFKKFHPRLNRTTLFWTKSFLLNTIKPFSGHKNRSLTKSQTTLQGSTLKFWVCRTSSWPKILGEPKFHLSGALMGLWWGTNFCQRWRRRQRHVTNGKKYCFFSRFMTFIGKKHDLSKKNLNFWIETNTFNILFHIWWK
jgi:hypothetical protein